MNIPEITSIVSALKAVTEITQSIIKKSRNADIHARVAELLTLISDIHLRLSDLQNLIGFSSECQLLSAKGDSLF